NRQSDNQITERHTHSLFGVSRFKDAEREILERKMRSFWDLDERTKRHVFSLNHEDHRGHEESFRFFPFENFVSFVVIKEARARANLRAAHRSCNCRMTSRICGDTAAVRRRSSIRATRGNHR